MINAVPVFRLFEKKGMDHLPRVYISDPVALPQQQNSGEIFANMQRIIRSYDSMSGIVLELKRIINSPKWNTAWISLFAEFGWYIIKNIIRRARKHNFDIVFYVNHTLFKMLLWKHPIHNIHFKLFTYLYFFLFFFVLFCFILNTAYANVLSEKFSFAIAVHLSA